MAQDQKAPKSPQDPYASRGKKLASRVQRLRSWVGSDPSRSAELADALVELNAHRLLGHEYAAAAPDAQDALRRSAELLTAKGPIGPYTSVDDAVRYLTAVVHVAVTQAGLGLPESAGRTIASVDEVKEQLSDLPLQERLDPLTGVWALWCSARSALGSGNVNAATAYADAALSRLAESGQRGDQDSDYLTIDIDRLASDSRWAAGRVEESIEFLHSAKERYDQVVDGRLREPARLSPALLARLAEPLFGMYRDTADRLVASGEVDLGLVTRRELVALLRGLGRRLGQSSQVQLASALTDLADDLLKSDRVEEADACSLEAAETRLDSPAAGSTRLLAASVRARVLARTGRGAEAVPMLRNVISAEGSNSSAARAVALLALAEASRSVEDAESAMSADQEFEQLARTLLGASVAGNDLRSAVSDAARGVVSRGSRRESMGPVPTSESYTETPAWLEAERAEAHRLELERLEQARVDAARREAEQAAAESAAAKRAAEEQARVERAERAEAERREAAEAAERLERKRRREERLEQHRLEVERREAERREAERLEAERQAAARSETDPAEAERQELERISAELAELEHAEAERAEAERQAAQRAEAERQAAQRAEAERAAAQAQAERATAERAEESDRKPADEDELAVALSEWRETRSRGDRRGARAANERVVELLRPRAQTDLAAYGPQLLDALEELSRARLRSGDVWGSRAPAREAKALAKILSR